MSHLFQFVSSVRSSSVYQPMSPPRTFPLLIRRQNIFDPPRVLTHPHKDIRKSWLCAARSKRCDPRQVPPTVPQVALQRAAAVSHTSASLGLPQAWTSTKMTRPYFDPVLESVNLAASLIPNHTHGDLVKSWLECSIVNSLTPTSGDTS